MSATTLKLTLLKEVERLAKIEAPSRRAKDARHCAEQLKAGELLIAEVIRGAMRELREVYGLSWQELGDEFGVSRQRAREIVNT